MTILEAIDRLNSWVRSDSARGWWSSPRYAVYDWKSYVIERAIRAGKAECSAIYLSLTCRECGGTKRYTDSSGYKWPHCRKCSSTGVVRLEFVVTKIEGFQWHSPRERSWRFGLPSELWQGARLSIDWEPNAKGRDLEPWQVAECLNVCEEAVERGELCKPGSHGYRNPGDYDDEEIPHGNYKLELGRGPQVCEICGAVPVPKDPAKPEWLNGIYHHCTRGHVSWCSWGCDACERVFAHSMRWSDEERKYLPHGGNGRSIFDEFRPPLDRMQHPEIQKWLARRNAVEVTA